MVAIAIPISAAQSANSSQPLKLNRLLQLCSANLPVGGFSFSQGLEYAVEQGWLKDTESTASWISTNLKQAIAYTDLAVLKRLIAALYQHDLAQFSQWNELILASRESYELHMADVAMGKALVRLLNQLDNSNKTQFEHYWQQSEISFISAFAIAASMFDIDLLTAQSGYCWTFIDNQVAAATKLVPLGQTQAQNLLFDLSEQVEDAITLANQLADEDVGASLPHLAMASAWHETQYTRLFRS